MWEERAHWKSRLVVQVKTVSQVSMLTFEATQHLNIFLLTLLVLLMRDCLEPVGLYAVATIRNATRLTVLCSHLWKLSNLSLSNTRIQAITLLIPLLTNIMNAGYFNQLHLIAVFQQDC